MLVTIVDPDEGYRDRFYPRFMQHKGPLQLQWARSPEELRGAPQNTCALLLIDPAFSEDPYWREQRWTFVPVRRWSEKSETNAICKMQSVDQIYREMLFVLSEERQQEPDRLHPANGALTLFMSTEAPATTKAFSRAVAKDVANRQASATVFFRSIDLLAPSDEFFEQTDRDYTLSDLILSMRMPKGNPALRMAACESREDGFSTIRMPLRRKDLLEITDEEWAHFFSLLKEKYDVVLLSIHPDFLVQRRKACAEIDRIVWLGNETSARDWSSLADYPWKEGWDYLLPRKPEQQSLCVDQKEGKEVVQWMIENLAVKSV